jgi:hypothetical protein
VSYAHTAILLFNVIAVIAYPVIGHAAGLSEHALGLFAENHNQQHPFGDLSHPRLRSPRRRLRARAIEVVVRA